MTGTGLRWHEWRRQLLLFLAVAAVRGAYAHFMVQVPYVFGDEAGYLLKAAALAGHVSEGYSSYYPAYALLLVPAFLVAGDPLKIFIGVQAINALLAGAGALLMYRIARRFSADRSPARATIVAAAISAYPSFLAFGCFALSENLFVPLTLALGLAVMRYADRPARGAAVWLGLLCGVLALTHPKGVIVDAAACFAVGRPIWRQRRWLDGCVVLIAATGVFLPAYLLLDTFFRETLGRASDGMAGHYPGAAGVLRSMFAMLDWKALRELAGSLLGQAFYLAAGTLGTAVVGLRVLCRHGSNGTGRAPADSGAGSYARFGLLACAATMLMTAWFMHGEGRVDQIFYGRYDEGVIALLMLPALAADSRAPDWTLAACGVLLTGGLVAAFYGSSPSGWLVEIDIIGLQLWRGLFPDVIDSTGLHLSVIVLATATLLLGIAAIARRGALRPLIIGLFLSTALVAGLRYLRPTSDMHAPQHAIADYVKTYYPTLHCVDYDLDHGDYWGRYNYQFFLLPWRLHQVSLAARADDAAPGLAASGRIRPPRCGSLMISSDPHLQQKQPGSTLLLRETRSTQALWSVPRQPDER